MHVKCMGKITNETNIFHVPKTSFPSSLTVDFFTASLAFFAAYKRTGTVTGKKNKKHATQTQVAALTERKEKLLVFRFLRNEKYYFIANRTTLVDGITTTAQELLRVAAPLHVHQ